MLFYGPPGTGKSMLASRLPGILPTLSHDEAVEVAKIYSIKQPRPIPQFFRRPFRRPHHTASAVSLVGGGTHPKPGEISLAHHGVLFLDELPEFKRSVLEVLREPLETGGICIARAAAHIELPAKFQLIAAMNPCPCGYYGDKRRQCRCTISRIEQYRQRISGPLLDRIDMHVAVNALAPEELQNKTIGESSAKIKQRVDICRSRQVMRQNCYNHALEGKALREFCQLNQAAQTYLIKAIEKLGLSGRVYDRILRLSRTIADLNESENIETQHLSEAFSYRQLDRLSKIA